MVTKVVTVFHYSYLKSRITFCMDFHAEEYNNHVFLPNDNT